MKNISCFPIQRCGARLHHLFLILAVLPLFVNAQTYYPLVTEGKTWSVKHEYCKSAYPHTSEYVKFEGNVTINDTVYKQVWTSSDTVLHAWAGAGLIREDDQKRVWMRGLSHEKLLYDFGALPGDTLWLNDNPEPYVMGIIDSVMILTGEYRRQFHLIYPFPTCEEIWIEGIGCLTGILNSGTCTFVGDTPDLICMIDHDTELFHNSLYPECHVITGTDPSLQLKPAISLFPNPVSGNIHIEFQDLHNSGNLELYDAFGRKMMSRPVTDTQRSLTVDLQWLSPGVYFVKFGSGSEKFIKTGN